MLIAIERVTVDAQVQLTKRGVDDAVVATYADSLNAGVVFPPLVAFDDGKALWLADGFHRLAAYRFCGLTAVEVDVKSGSQEDAMIYAATANVDNSRLMNRAQKREAGERLLRMTDWSDREIARKLAVDPKTVGNWRRVSMENSIDRSTRTGVITRRC
jgi:ParB-like chromosome segregation protein Spo0J